VVKESSLVVGGQRFEPCLLLGFIWPVGATG